MKLTLSLTIIRHCGSQAIESAQSDHAAVVQSILANKEAHLEKIRELFGKLGDDDGIITYTAFEEKISSQEVREYFESLGLDVWDAWTFFKLLDSDSGGAVETDTRAHEVRQQVHATSWSGQLQSTVLLMASYPMV